MHLDSRRKTSSPNAYQKSIDAFQVVDHPEKREFLGGLSLRQLEKEAEEYLKQFESSIKHVKQTNTSLEELGKMFRSGEITENAYRLLRDELTQDLSLSVENIFHLRDALELTKARAKIGLIREKSERKTVQQEQSSRIGSAQPYQVAYSPDMQRWEGIINRIESVLSSMSIEEETSIIENYLSLLKNKTPAWANSEENRRTVSLLQQRLASILEKWTEIRRNKIEQIMNLEIEASKLRDEIKELEVRFAVGELEEVVFESRISTLKGNLRNTEQEIANIRKFIDDMDTKVFRCSDLLRETQ
ncbi:MAG: hypothetical protein NZ952_02100 [Candidatus Bathyarchaeota archaeon]|nr:hypothetical protein [Candidatus Bathyarchaeota archaeon]